MKIALVHYHLRAGGVTSVIQSQIDALKGRCELLLLSSEKVSKFQGVKAITVPGLAYDRKGCLFMAPVELSQEIIGKIRENWPSGCDVLHVHNPLLSKNRSLLEALKRMRDGGISLFLQVHDFAEDGRPLVYSPEAYVEDVHYGVLNRGDYQVLQHSGLKEDGLHLLPNAVREKEMPLRARESYILYPVRGIRRKNLGEAILLSRFWDKRWPLAVTLAPNSPADFRTYNDWKGFVKEEKFNVRFEVGVNRLYRDILSEALFFITTSVNEGFGFTFIEPWLAGKAVAGRLLLRACGDFIEKGLDFRNFYTSLNIHPDLLNWSSFKIRWFEAFNQACRMFRLHWDAAEIDRAFLKMTQNGGLDFACLDEIAQREVLAHQKGLSLIKALNPLLERLSHISMLEEGVSQNRDIVRDLYSVQRYGDRLISIYEKVIKRKIYHSINKEILLRHFLHPASFRMIQWQSE